MEHNKIRAILIGKDDPKTAFRYVVGTEHTVIIDSRPVKYKIDRIDDDKTHYFIYLSIGGEAQFWRKVPKNDATTEEYFID